MNSFFNKIKQKLNKTTTQDISGVKQIIHSFQVTAKPFQKQQINRRVESICEHCNKWQTLIVNEPSMGLYFCQTHYKRCIQSKIKFIDDVNKQTAKRQITLKQVARTNQQIKQIGGLSNQWFNRVSAKLQQLSNQKIQSKK